MKSKKVMIVAVILVIVVLGIIGVLWAKAEGYLGASKISDSKIQKIYEMAGVSAMAEVVDGVERDTNYKNKQTYYTIFGLGTDKAAADTKVEEYKAYLLSKGYKEDTSVAGSEYYKKDNAPTIRLTEAQMKDEASKVKGQYALYVSLIVEE